MDNKMKQRLNQRSAQLMGPRIERRVEQLMTRADIINQQFGTGSGGQFGIETVLSERTVKKMKK